MNQCYSWIVIEGRRVWCDEFSAHSMHVATYKVDEGKFSIEIEWCDQ